MGCYNSAVINAPAGEIWDVLKNFHDWSWAKNVITNLEKVGDKSSNEVGAQRILNGGIPETLLSINDAAKSLTYSIDDGPEALSKDNMKGYVGSITVYPVSNSNSSFVLWTSEWESDKSGGVADFCNPIYHALLQDLKSHFS